MNKERLLALVKGVSPQYLIILYLVAVLAAGLAVSSIFLYPQEMRIFEMSRQLSAEKQKVAVIESFILAHPDTEQYLTQLQQSLAKADQALPGSLDVSKFIAQLEKDARESGVKLLNIKPSAMTDRAGYREMPVEVSIEGQFYSTMAFLKRLEDGERFSLPSAFLIQQKPGGLSTRLNLQIFCYGVTPKPSTTAAVSGQPLIPGLPAIPALPALPKAQ